MTADKEHEILDANYSKILDEMFVMKGTCNFVILKSVQSAEPFSKPLKAKRMLMEAIPMEAWQ
jgi:hypothetical protein